MENERTLTVKGEGMARGQKVEIKEIPINKIKIGRNSRLSVSKEDLSGLMQSINSTGLLEPIGVIKSNKHIGNYEIAYGNRRFMAFSKLGLHSIPAVIHEYKNESDIDTKNLAENVQRRNISLAEIGRYASILEGEGLSKKELAVRLGVPVNYLDSCLSAYQFVPKEFRNDLETTVSGKPAGPGKISISAVKAIAAVDRSFDLNKSDRDILFKAAKNDERFDVANVSKYAAAIKRGNKDPIASAKPLKTLTFKMIIDEGQYDSLVHKHVENGPFRSFTALVKAVCRGQKQVVINFLD